MSVLVALAEKLNSASVAVTASNMFIGILPDTPDLCVALYEYAGAAPLEVMQDDSATLEQPSIQIMTRGARNDYPAARELMVNVRDTLCSITDETISGVRFLRVHNQSSMNALGTDEKDRPEFSLSLRAVVER